MSQGRILLLENIHVDAKKNLEAEGFEVELLTKALPEAELVQKVRGAVALGIRSKTQITKKVIDAAKGSVRVFGAFCIGTNQIALDEATKAGIPVFNAPFSNTRSVAEMILAEIVMLSRRLGDRNREMHRGVWTKSAVGSNEVRGKTLGIVGYGHIGRQIGVLAESMGMHVIFQDIAARLPMGNNRNAGKLDALLAEADFVTLHVPETRETKDMIGEAELSKMKKGACLLNASRGTVVVIPALAAAIKSGQIGGAAVDVFPVEPEGNTDPFLSELMELPNVILTPHIGGSTSEAQVAIGHEVSGSLIKFLTDGTTTGSVSFPQAEMPRRPGVHRIAHVHRNVPGVLRDVNRIVSEADANVVAQVLATDPSIGYLLMDLEDDQKASAALVEKMRALETTISATFLY